MVQITAEITDYLNRVKAFSKNSKIFLFSNALIGAGFGIFWVILNLYILELGVTPTFLGVFISSHLTASALFLIPGGAISDSIGRKKTLLLSTALLFWSVIVLCITKDKYTLIAANSVRGVGDALIMVTIVPFMAEQSNNYERMHLFSVNAALNSFSIMFGTLVGGLLPSTFAFTAHLAEQYRFTLLTTSLFVLTAFFTLLFIKERIVTRPVSKPFSGNKTFVAQFAIFSAIVGLGAGVIVPFFNVYFSRVLNAPAAHIGFIFSVSQLSVGVASLVLPVMVHRLGKVTTTVMTQALSIPFMLVILSHRLVTAFVGFFFRMTFMNMSHPAQQHFFMDHIQEHERAKAVSITQFGSILCRAAGSNLGGYLIDTKSFSYPFYVAALLYGISTALFYVFFKGKEQ